MRGIHAPTNSALFQSSMPIQKSGREVTRHEKAIGNTSHPNCGLKAWGVVLGSWCALINCFGIMNSIGAFQEYLRSEELANYSDDQIGWIFGVYVFLTFLCGAFAGPIFDTYGPRWLLITGSAMQVLSMILLSVHHGKSDPNIVRQIR